MLGWGQVELAKKAHIHIGTIRLMELYAGEVVNYNADSLLGVIEALKTGGVNFIEGGVQVAQVIAVEDSALQAKPKMVSEKVARSSKK
jgi:hypothetical protein